MAIRTMSVQFGMCNFDGDPVDPHDLDQVRGALVPYGPDGEGRLCRGNFGVLYRAFHTTRESRSERQPYVSRSGTFMTWDGRLDNREGLIERLADGLSPDSTDLEIAAASYERWGTDAFRELVGDWALAAWHPKDQLLVLAKDFLGTRHLYYSFQGDRVIWCTILDPLVIAAGRCFKLDEEYIAGWLSLSPATHLTPYVGIHAVPPGSWVRLSKHTDRTDKYWNFDSSKNIRYRSDGEYEEHFRSVFSESVRRRLRSDTPVLAELSGGMDSSSIVCMADLLSNTGAVSSPSLHTISYFDDTEANWNERPYVARVEEKRRQTGCHIDVSAHSAVGHDSCERFASTPGAAFSCDDVTRRFAACLMSDGHRVVLSGIGGDEVTGGLPTPIPELADLLATCEIRKLARQLRLWALEKRKPWIHLLLEMAAEFLSPKLVATSRDRRSASWLSPEFFKRHRQALIGAEPRLRLFGRLPSFQTNLNTLDALRRQFACCALPANPVYERRYPYLDRSLLEFLYAIPPEQLVRPGQRRSLMRRALIGIVPDELLHRRRKAYVSAGLRETVLAQWRQLNATTQKLACAALGIVENQFMVDTIQRVARGTEAPTLTLMRTLTMEAWLRAALRRGVLARLAHA